MLLTVLAVGSVAAQDPAASGVTNQNQPVVLPFPQSFGGDVDRVNIENGSLTINIPILNLKGRGLSYNFGLRFSSGFWGVTFNPNASWTVMAGNYLPGHVVGWETTQPYSTAIYSQSPCGTNGTVYRQGSYIFTDSSGGKHTFGVLGSVNATLCGVNQNYNYTNSTQPDDFSDGIIATMGPNQTAVSSITLADGTVLTPGGSSPSAHIVAGSQSYANGLGIATDTNANSQSVYPAGTDTIGRTPVTVSTGTSPQGQQQIIYTVSDSNGDPQHYTVNLESISVNTTFNTGPKEATGITSTEVQSIQLPNGLQYSFTYDNFGEISEMTLPTGAQITYEWSTIQELSGGPAYRYVNSRTTTVDGVRSEWQLSLSCPASCSPGLINTVTDPANNQQVYTFNQQFATSVKQYNGAASGTPLVQYAIQPSDPLHPGSSLPSSVTTTWANGLTTRTSYSYDQFTYPNQTCIPGNHCTTNNPTFSNGNVTSIQEYDWGNGSPGSLLRQTFRSYLYQLGNGGPVDRILEEDVYDGSAACTTATSCTANLLAQTQYTYDGNNASSNHKGNLTSVARLVSPSKYLTTSYSYDAYGNVISETDPKSNVTHFVYTNQWDSATNSCQPSGASAYLTSVKDALSHTTSYTYYACTGLIQAKKDPNDIAAARSGMTSTYDEVNAPLITTYPDGGSVSNNYNGYALPLKVTSTRAATPDPAIVTTTTYDELGRPKQTAITSDPVAPILVDTTYDSFGRVASVSNPYRSSGDVTYGIMQFQYDALGRKALQVQPDNSTLQWCYNNSSPGKGNCLPNKSSQSGHVWVDYSDETGRHWQQVSDGLGRLTAVMEPDSSNTPALETDYGYDATNNLQRVDQWGGANSTSNSAVDRVRAFTYDQLTRLLTATNPETGTVTYSYVNSGGLCAGEASVPCSRTDARGLQINYGYDALSRMTAKSASDGSFGYGYTYDVSTISGGFSSANPIGRLVEASNGINASSQYSYDSMGRVVIETNCIPSNCITTGNSFQAQYDLAGNIKSLSYPDGRVIAQALDGAGHLSQIANGSLSGYSYITSTQYWPNGAVEGLYHGDGVADGFRLNTRLHADGISFVRLGTIFGTGSGPGSYSPNVMLSGKTYCYGPAATTTQTAGAACPSLGSFENGNILQIIDRLNGNNSQAFSYDNLNRIAAFTNGSGTMQQTYSIDPWGNMAMSGTATSGLGFSGEAKNRDTSGTVGYDAAGNALSVYNGISRAAFTYDADGKMLTAGSGSATYTYDANGNRVRKDVSGSWTEYLYFNGQPLAEKDADGTWSDYIYANGQRMVRADGYDIRLHMSGTNCSGSGCSTNTVAGTLSITAANGYVIRSGDVLSWRQYQTGVANGGMDVYCTDNTNIGLIGNDTDGQPMDTDSTMNTWHVREVDLSPWAGKTIKGVYPGNWASGGGSWQQFFGDIILTSTDGTSITLYSRSLSSQSPFMGPGVIASSLSVVTEKVADTTPLTTTTYYHGDQIGSTQIMTAATGWPVSSYTYYPYGQQPQPGINHYLFTGKERDQESGLDYFGARFYSSSIGRFMNPDWSSHPQAIPYADMENPQSLNLYGYVLNNPLSNRDTTGHYCDPDFTTTNKRTGAVTVHGGQCHLDWWDFMGHAWVGFSMMLTANNGHQMAAGAAHMAYGYGATFASGWAVGKVIEGVGTIVQSAGGKVVVERVMSMAELESTESTGLLKGGRGGTLGNPNFVTDSAPDTAEGARQLLALPGTPTVKVTMELDTSGLGAALGESSPVASVGPLSGGGTERIAIGQMPAKILSVQALK